MKLRNLFVLLTSLSFVTLSHAASSDKDAVEKPLATAWAATPTEDSGDDDEETTQADCILWPGCIVVLDKKSM